MEIRKTKIRLFGLSFYVDNVLYLYSKVGETNRWHTLDMQNIFYGSYYHSMNETKEQIAIQDRMIILWEYFKLECIIANSAGNNGKQ